MTLLWQVKHNELTFVMSRYERRGSTIYAAIASTIQARINALVQVTSLYSEDPGVGHA